MIVPDTHLRRAQGANTPGQRLRRQILLSAAGILVVGSATWVIWLNRQIQYYAHHDEARPTNAIAVFGAAEYDGRPSPVLRARLEHGLALYRRGFAPLIITLGGGYAADGQHSEGGVGESFLIAQGVPERAIIAETESDDTEQSVERLAAIARENDLKTILVVSDGTHLFRIRALCEHDGLTVYTSPRAVRRSISWGDRMQRLVHEVLSYTAWRLHLH